MPRHGESWFALANLKTYRFSAEEMTRMADLLEDDQLTSNDRAFVCFALGKAHEDAGEYEHSFHFYQVGNAIKRSQSGYDRDRMSAELAGYARTYSAALFEQFAGSGCPDPDPIFIVGLPRAGSTLLEQILSSHSQVDGTLELPDILALTQRLRRMAVPDGNMPGYPDVLPQLSADQLTQMGARYLEDTRIHREGAPRFIDKMPNNFRHIGLIKLILPNARVIDARREPMACCFSGYKQLFAEGQEFTYSLEDIGSYYRDYVDLMNHWDTALPGFVLRVQHEDLLEDLEGQVRRILAFCDLPFEQQCLRYWETDRAVRTPSSEQVRQPIFTSSRDQWQHFSTWLDPLRTALGPDLLDNVQRP
jgi:hypothetical protein